MADRFPKCIQLVWQAFATHSPVASLSFERRSAWHFTFRGEVGAARPNKSSRLPNVHPIGTRQLLLLLLFIQATQVPKQGGGGRDMSGEAGKIS